MECINQDAARFEGCIGVFDSGVGGISVLKELVKVLPDENFIFYGDSANAPYGEKTTEQVLALSQNIAEYLIAQGVKAIVIACNTATSVAAEKLRKEHPDLPIIGVEPALKPAAQGKENSKVLVMATPITLRQEKYLSLSERLGGRSEFIPLECAGLAKRIEKGDLWGDDLMEMLGGFLAPYKGKVDSVVLGCTHYPFIREQIKKVLGDVPLYDGSAGTARELRRKLAANGLARTDGLGGKVVFESSMRSEEELELYRWFYGLEI